MRLLSLAVVVAIPAARAHMSIWHPSGYSFDKGPAARTPLANLPFEKWWFHGYFNETPAEVLSLTPGSDVTLEIACDKSFTSYGSQSTSDACPNDSGAYHAGATSFTENGWTGNNEAQLLGCALAIAYKSDARTVQPEDFIVMSVQERCVRQRDTSFSIPSNLPACPPGGCVCSWFWSGKNSDLEMYMSGFRCDVNGGVATTDYPKPAKPVKNAITGPTQPFYWANDLLNLEFTPTWETKPSYNSAWGWAAGAQELAFAGANGSGGGGTGGAQTPVTPNNGTTPSPAPQKSSAGASGNNAQLTSSRRHRPRPTATTSPAWNNLAAESTPQTGGNDTVSTGTGKPKNCHNKRSRRRSEH